MRAIGLIATNTVRQTVRDRLYYNIAFFGLGMVVFSMVVGNITFGFPDRVVRSIGLTGFAVALNLLALLVGVGLVHQEIDRRSLFVVLTRPIRRAEYICGRYLGLLGATLLIGLGLGIVFSLILTSVRGHLTMQDVFALGASVGEAALIGALGVVISSFSTPTVGAGLGIGFWLVCATTDDLVRLTANSEGAGHVLAQGLAYAMPSLARLNFRDAAVYQLPVEFGHWMGAMLYAGVYVVVFLAPASAILSRREMV